MKLLKFYKLIIYILILYRYKSFIIADQSTVTSTTTTTEPKNKDSPTSSDTKVIEIKVSNDNKKTENNASGVKIQEVKPNTTDTPDTSKTNDATIATITVNIPNQSEQKVEIKNVDNKEQTTDKNIKKTLVKDQKKGPVKEEEEEEDNDTSFIHRITKFIKSDFRFLVKFGAVLSSTLNQMIPLNIILTIRKHRSTRNLKILNFVTSFVSSSLWSLYGTLMKNPIIMVSNMPGVVVNMVGIWIFNKYCSDQSQSLILDVSSKVGVGLAAILFILYFVLSAQTFLTVVGLCGGTILAISLISPLVSFNEILESRNTSTMPTEISLGNFITSFFMFSYGFIIWDLLVIAPSFMGVVSGLIQLTLIFLFPHSDRIIISEVEILEQPNNFKSMLTIDQEV